VANHYNTCWAQHCNERIDTYIGYTLAKFDLGRDDGLLSPARFFCPSPACTPFGAAWIKQVDGRERPKPIKEKPETLQEKAAKKAA
jgi:hypothetical protein